MTPAALRHTCAEPPRGPVALGEVAGLEWEGRWVVKEVEGCEAIIETRDRWILVEIRGKWTLAVPRLTCLALEEASEVCTTPECTPTHTHTHTLSPICMLYSDSALVHVDLRTRSAVDIRYSNVRVGFDYRPGRAWRWTARHAWRAERPKRF